MEANVKRKSHESGVSRSLKKRVKPAYQASTNKIQSKQKSALLTLKDDLDSYESVVIEGYSFGAERNVAGEVVFNTGMVGYPESLTDPSYRGQILVLTYPLIGNYGVPGDEKDEHGLIRYFESNQIQIKGLIVSEYSSEFSHWNAKRSLSEWLKSNNIPALTGVDTRRITKLIREKGSMLGKIEFDGNVGIDFFDPNKTNLVAEVSTKEAQTFNPGKRPRILAYDCGMKYNIIRYFVKKGVELTVVPYNYQLSDDFHEFDGLFISNGPGDPTMVKGTIENIRRALVAEKPKPIFGICLGNQLLALAAGAKTYKMKYGNRGMNQPCIDLRTTKCYITPQNHGYAVDDSSLPDLWNTFFMNANDMTNEGIIHTSKPFFSVQFHPEACGGPLDTSFLFDMFLDSVAKDRNNHTLVPPQMYNIKIVKKCILVGSGGLSIGQAGEFDYSGSQAIKALKEEGIEVILINPNIATVQTSPGFADKVYFLPVTPETVLDVIRKERPDAILVSMGGQTALNVGIKLFESGVLDEHNVQVLGTPIETIIATEDREAFARKLAEINEHAAKSMPATNVEEAVEAARIIGYPVLVRAAFALGGLGSGFAENETELTKLAKQAFASSSQILIDEDLRGWKEVEYEVVRDCKDNCITVCNMENFDPLGIHTGDSIVIAPSQTLTNSEYFKLRETALKVVRHLGVIGECNIQYALHPESERYCIIEVNARLSRSSALASKATGYPLAYVAAKLALGKDLVMLRNSVTEITTACFEPALDYLVAKVPRWDLKKFDRVSDSLGSSMKSVGEVMAIGRTFEEVIQKAVRMADHSLSGFDDSPLFRKSVVYSKDDTDLDKKLKNPTPLRIFAIARALELDYSLEKLHSLTKIDRWYLSKLKNIIDMKKEMRAFKNGPSSFDAEMMRAVKRAGFSDLAIAEILNATEQSIRLRRKELKILPYVKQIDTLAAEFPAQTNYLYMTYSGSEHDLDFKDHGVMVLGNGPYCIGSSVEFDWCAVSCVRTLRANKIASIVVNHNPETVSTDYDESDRLYFEELSFERVMDIYEIEASVGVIVCVGGQIPNCLALRLDKASVKILGTSAHSIDQAEDRKKFSALCDKIGVDQPKWESTTNTESACRFAEEVGYPVLVRPSYVLSGAAMRVASNKVELLNFLENAADVSDEHPVVISKFILNAKEVEFDAVADEGEILNYAISEHVENAGVHSGDATLVLPAQKLYVETIRRVKRIAGNVAAALRISGPFNMQFICKNNDVKVIECNLRASRTFPFVSKTFKCNFIELATKVMVEIPTTRFPIKLLDLDYVGIKAPMFSFQRLLGADPTLGVEMASTGEVACFGQDMHEAFLLSLMATGFKIPKKSVFFSVGPQKDKQDLAPYAKVLEERGFEVFATKGTYDYFSSQDIRVRLLDRNNEESGAPNALDFISDGHIDLVINIPDSRNSINLTEGYRIRRTAVDFGISLITNAQCAEALIRAMENVSHIPCLSMEEIYLLGTATKAMQKPPSIPLRKKQDPESPPQAINKESQINGDVKSLDKTKNEGRWKSRGASFTEPPPLMVVNKIN